MILSDTDIWQEIEKGGLKFEPMVEDDQIGTSAIDLRLANVFTVPKKPPSGIAITIDPAKISPEEALEVNSDEIVVQSGEKFNLEPGAFVLGYTLERVELSNYLAARIEGRSSFARLGVSVHQTAPTVHAKFAGQLRLEISNIGPYTVLLEPGSIFCQLIVERLSSPSETASTSQWQGQGPSV